MTVYLLMKYVQHESGGCLGVFSRREYAEKIKAEVAEESWYYDYEVEEFTVDDTSRACSGHVHSIEINDTGHVQGSTCRSPGLCWEGKETARRRELPSGGLFATSPGGLPAHAGRRCCRRFQAGSTPTTRGASLMS